MDSSTYPKPIFAASHTEEYQEKRQPDDADRVHGETDMFGLVEILRYPPCFDRVQRARNDKDHVVNQRAGNVFVVGLTDENQAPLVVFDL